MNDNDENYYHMEVSSIYIVILAGGDVLLDK